MGEPIYFQADAPFSEERVRVARQLTDAINSMAMACGDVKESAVRAAQ